MARYSPRSPASRAAKGLAYSALTATAIWGGYVIHAHGQRLIDARLQNHTSNYSPAVEAQIAPVRRAFVSRCIGASLSDAFLHQDEDGNPTGMGTFARQRNEIEDAANEQGKEFWLCVKYGEGHEPVFFNSREQLNTYYREWNRTGEP